MSLTSHPSCERPRIIDIDYTCVSQTVGRDPKVGRKVLPGGSPKSFGKYLFFRHLFVKCMKYCLPLTLVLGVLHSVTKFIKILTTRDSVNSTLSDFPCKPA